jgi:hypothetical protein
MQSSGEGRQTVRQSRGGGKAGKHEGRQGRLVREGSVGNQAHFQAGRQCRSSIEVSRAKQEGSSGQAGRAEKAGRQGSAGIMEVQRRQAVKCRLSGVQRRQVGRAGKTNRQAGIAEQSMEAGKAEKAGMAE